MKMKDMIGRCITPRHAMVCILGLQAVCLGSAQALTINLNDVGGVTAGSIAEAGFQEAAALWEGLFSDNVTVNIDVGFSSLGAGILGSTGSTQGTVDYTSTRNALLADVTSVGDSIATSNLQGGSSFDTYFNFTSDNPNGVGSATRYLDNDGGANNTNVQMTLANARALGLFAATDSTVDATIQFNSDFSFDFDGSNGIAAGFFDFVGVAAHEIGHALGFVSGVDVLDYNAANVGFFNDDEFRSTTLDLFRYSELSAGAGVLDGSVDGSDRYFSIDGGSTNLAFFSEGRNLGDGNQASHWRDNLGIGIMDPTAAPGEFLSISSLDLLAFDVIGWDFNSQAPIPEPATMTLLGIGLVGLAYRRRRQA